MGQDVAGLPEGHSALECVTNWLRDDNHGFVIPDTEWGRCLYSALGELVDALERVTPRVVTEVAELRELPVDAIVRSTDGSAWRRVARGFDVNLWVPTGGTRQDPHYTVPLPATVLVTPTGKETE